MSLVTKDSGDDFPQEDECQIEILESFNLLQDYFQSPVFSINLEIQQIYQHVLSQISGVSFQDTPYLPQTYGKFRKEAYLKFTSLIQHNYGNFLRQHKKIFHEQIDTKAQEYFHQKWSIPGLYSSQMQQQKAKGSMLKVKREYDFNNSELTLDLLSAEVSGLVHNWYVIIDQTVDVFEQIELYEIKDVCNFREVWRNVSESQRKKPSPTWAEWFKEGVLGLGIIKGMFGRSEEKEGSEICDVDIKELYEQMVLMCCGKVVLGYFKNADSHYNMKILIKMKGYMLLLNQNVEAYVKVVKDLLGEFLENTNKEKEVENQKIFNETIDLFVNLQDSLTAFDEGFFKSYFKDEQKENSTHGTFPSSDE